MSQRDVYEILASHPSHWYSVDSIVKRLGKNEKTIKKNITELLKHGDIEVRYGIEKEKDKYVSKFKRYIRINGGKL